jgi:hypothetical protein
VCAEAVKTVKSLVCPDCEVVVYDLNKGCASGACRTKAKEYGVDRLPAVAVDGRLVECCQTEPVNAQALRAAGVGWN